MTSRTAWVLNLDAELELADPAYRPSPHMRAELRVRRQALLPSIRAETGADLMVLDPDGAVGRDATRPRVGDCWCPTPSALALLRSAGAVAPSAPEVTVLRRVNHRAFAAELEGGEFPGARFVTTIAECESVWSSASDDRWLLKRPFGFSGRQRKVVTPRELDSAARTWIEASMRGYGTGLMVEPLIERLADFGLHGRLGADGTVCVGAPVVLTTDGRGGFVAARRSCADDLDTPERVALEDAFARVASGLRGAGYFGPFGIDAFRWRARDGRIRFRPLCEINARYSMAWWTGMRGA